MNVYRFQVSQTSRDHSLAIFMLLQSYGVSSPPYIESKWNLTGEKRNPLPLDEKSLTDKKNPETNKSALFSIQNQRKKVWFWMSDTQNNKQW